MGLLNNIWQKFILITLLFKAERQYPLFNLLLQDYRSYNLLEDINFQDTFNFKEIELDHYENSKELLKDLKLLAQTEKTFLKKKNENIKMLPKLSLTLQIIKDAQDAIQKLEQINKSNKKIAYYERSKNANLNDLIAHFTKKLSSKNEDEVHLPIAKNEIKIKRLIARLKKRHPLIINHYLALMKIYDIESYKVPDNEKKLLKGIKHMIEFFTLGHASKSQIHKSVAIQLYTIYKNDFKHTQLTLIIGNIIDITLDTDKPYINFENFNQNRAYIKNRVHNFILYDLNDELNSIQSEKMKQFFEDILVKERIFFIRPFTRRWIHNFVNYPLEYMLLLEQIKSFGYTPRKK